MARGQIKRLRSCPARHERPDHNRCRNSVRRGPASASADVSMPSRSDGIAPLSHNPMRTPARSYFAIDHTIDVVADPEGLLDDRRSDHDCPRPASRPADRRRCVRTFRGCTAPLSGKARWSSGDRRTEHRYLDQALEITAEPYGRKRKKFRRCRYARRGESAARAAPDRHLASGAVSTCDASVGVQDHRGRLQCVRRADPNPPSLINDQHFDGSLDDPARDPALQRATPISGISTAQTGAHIFHIHIQLVSGAGPCPLRSGEPALTARPFATRCRSGAARSTLTAARRRAAATRGFCPAAMVVMASRQVDFTGEFVLPPQPGFLHEGKRHDADGVDPRPGDRRPRPELRSRKGGPQAGGDAASGLDADCGQEPAAAG